MNKVFCLLLISCLSCTRSSQEPEYIKPIECAYSLKEREFNDSPLPYEDITYKESLDKYKQSLIGKSDAEKKKLWFDLMNYIMPHYWNGTDWDFNGVTTTPQQGSIACGYFVTTLLEDSGIQLNRIKLAQSVSSKMIIELSNKNTIKRLSDFDSLKNYIKDKGSRKDIFIVGLDFHTGFIIKEEDNLYFFHSDYASDRVVKEYLNDSNTLKSSQSFMIGSVYQNKAIFQNLK